MCRKVFLFVFLLYGNFLHPLEAVIDEYMNPSVNPCEDFHQYACGKWNEINSNVLDGDTLSLLDATTNGKISAFLESKQTAGILQKTKTFYESCRSLQVYNMSKFLEIIEPRSGWAVSSTWNLTQFSWIHTIAELRKYGANIFLEQNIRPKWDNSSADIINLDTVELHKSTEEHLKALLKKASLRDSLAKEFILFEEQLAPFLTKRSDTSPKDFEAEEVVLGYLRDMFPQVDWVTYFNELFGEEIDLFTPLIIFNPESMTKLGEFLDLAKPETVCNYIMIKFLQFIDSYSIENNSPNECVTILHQAMPLAVDHINENHFYDHEYDQLVQDLFNYLKVEFLAGVSKLYEDQRDVLLFLYTKTSVMELQIGNSDRNMTTLDVTKYYDALTVRKDDFYRNFLEALRFKVSKDLATLRGESIQIAYQWTVTPSPMFLHSKNKIIVPLSLLQEKIFGKDPATNKYSVLGFIIAHEFLHGFDLNGVNYDYTGSMVESALTANPTFDDGARCIREEMGGNGIGEKIADLGGVRLAYNAFQRSLIQVGQNIMAKENGSARSLGQSFFIDFAQFFCGKSNKVSKGLRETALHDQDDLRIKRSLMNFNTFANSFDCAIGSAFNPEKKCTVW